MITQHPPK